MNNPDEVLRQKEAELVRLRQEIGALRLVIPLLVAETEDISSPNNASNASEVGVSAPSAAEFEAETPFHAYSEGGRSRNLLAKSFGDIQSFANLLRTKWTKPNKGKKAA
jgi:hypothetical protein